MLSRDMEVQTRNNFKIKKEIKKQKTDKKLNIHRKYRS